MGFKIIRGSFPGHGWQDRTPGQGHPDNRDRRRAGMPAHGFRDVLGEKPQDGAKEAELPVVLTTTPFGWRISKYYGPFTLSCSENDPTVWKQTGTYGRTKADADESARFKRDIAATAEGNPVIASILASCEALKE